MSAQSQPLDDFLENIPREAAKCRVRVGKRNSFRRKETFLIERDADTGEPEPIFDTVIDLVESEFGWGDDWPTLRVEFLNGKGICPGGRSWDWTETVEIVTGSAGGIGMSTSDPALIYARCLEANNREMRRMLGAAGEGMRCLADGMREMTTDRMRLLEAVEAAAADARGAESALTLLASEAEARDIIEAAATQMEPERLLFEVLDLFKGSKFSAKSLLRYIDSNPGAARELMGDPDVRKVIGPLLVE